MDVCNLFDIRIPVRFWDKVHVEPNSGCWIWRGAVDGCGYGRFGFASKNRHAHIVSYELIFGARPNETEIDHLCRTRSCVNPHHLECVTHAENMRRTRLPSGICKNGHIKGEGMCLTCRKEQVKANWRKYYTHVKISACPSGHVFDEKNTGRTSNGHRVCRACKREQAAAARARRRMRQ